MCKDAFRQILAYPQKNLMRYLTILAERDIIQLEIFAVIRKIVEWS